MLLNLSPSSTPITLEHAQIGVTYRVLSVKADSRLAHSDQHLKDLGFLPGEHVILKKRGLPGGDPIVVRIGSSNFALRRAEAACVLIEQA
jgi:ferrous iron transport protein A